MAEAPKSGWKQNRIISGDEMENGTAQDIACLTNRPTPVEWNDTYFLNNIVSTSIIKKTIPTKDDTKMHAKAFLNFYYTGEISESDIDESILYLFYYLKINGKRFFGTNLLIGEESWKAPASDLNMIMGLPTTDCFVEGTGRGVQQKLVCKVSPSGQNKTLTTALVKDWYTSLYENIGKSEVLYYLAFLAGVCYRLIVKEATSVETAICTNSYDRFSSLFAKRLPVNYSVPPNSNFYLKWQETVKKMSPKANRLLSSLITAQLYSSEVARDDVAGLSKAMCLLSLGSVGLGLLSWAYKAAEARRMTLAKFLSRMCIGPYHQAAINVYSLLKFQSDTDEKTFMYARLFREGAFQELSTKNCPEFAMACAAIALDATEDDPIWSIQQFSPYSQYISQVCEFAFVFKEVFYTKIMCNVETASGPAKALAQNYGHASKRYQDQRAMGRLNRRTETPVSEDNNRDDKSDDESSASDDEGNNDPDRDASFKFTF